MSTQSRRTFFGSRLGMGSKAALFSLVMATLGCGGPELDGADEVYADSEVYADTAALAPLPPGTVGTKWHPGHYVQPMGGDRSVNGWVMKQTYAEMKTTPAIVGLQLRFRWSELETAKNVYDFSIIDGHLAKLATMGNKRVMVVLSTKTFETTSELMPDYFTNPNNAGYSAQYEGGTYRFGNDVGGDNPNVWKGNAMKLWLPAVRERLVALMQALGARYNSNPYFEGMIISETAMGQSLTPITRAQEDAYYETHLVVLKAMRTAFPNTQTIQFVNYPRNMLSNFVGSMEDMGATLGGPDIFLDDEGLNVINKPNTPDGIYSYYAKLSGKLALAPSIMPGNFRDTKASGGAGSRQPSISELLNFAQNKLHATHLFWSRDPKFFSPVLNLLKSNNGIALQSGCPTALAPCITN